MTSPLLNRLKNSPSLAGPLFSFHRLKRASIKMWKTVTFNVQHGIDIDIWYIIIYHIISYQFISLYIYIIYILYLHLHCNIYISVYTWYNIVNIGLATVSTARSSQSHHGEVMSFEVQFSKYMVYIYTNVIQMTMSLIHNWYIAIYYIYIWYIYIHVY